MRVMESLQLVKVRAQNEILEVNLVVLEKRRLCCATRCPMLCAGTPSPHTALGQHPAGRSAGGALPFEEGKVMCYQGSQSLSDPLNPKDAGLHPNCLHCEQPRRGLNRMAGAAACGRGVLASRWAHCPLTPCPQQSPSCIGMKRCSHPRGVCSLQNPLLLCPLWEHSCSSPQGGCR